MARHLLTVLLLLLLSGCGPAETPVVDAPVAAAPEPVSAESAPTGLAADGIPAHAAETVALLRKGDAAAVAARLHYPPSYTAEQRAADEAAVALMIGIVLEQFGTLMLADPVDAPGPHYQVDITGGDGDYWAATLPGRSIREVGYRAEFSRYESGYVVLSYMEIDSGWVTGQLALGLDATVADNDERVQQTVLLAAERVAASMAPGRGR